MKNKIKTLELLTEAPRLFNSSTQFQTTPTVPLRTDYTTFVTTTNQTTATHMPNVTLSNNEESSFKNGLTKSAFSTSITKNFTSSQTSTMYKEKNETTSYILNETIVSLSKILVLSYTTVFNTMNCNH